MCFFFLFWQLKDWTSLCRMMYVQSLTLESCFHMQCWKFKFSMCSFENWILRGLICDMTNSLEVNPGQIFSIFIYSGISKEGHGVGAILRILMLWFVGEIFELSTRVMIHSVVTLNHRTDVTAGWWALKQNNYYTSKKLNYTEMC